MTDNPHSSTAMAEPTAAHGHDKQYAVCGARKKQGPGECTRPAGWGTPHPGIGRCKLHGGSTPDQVAAAGREQARQLVGRSLLGGAGVEPVTDSVGYLQELLGRLRHGVEMLDGIIGAVTDSDGRPVGLSDAQRFTLRELVPVLREARRAATDLARLGLEDRAVSVLESQAELMGQVEDRILARMLAGVLRALADVEGATGVVERVWPGLVSEVVPAEWSAIEQGGETS